MRTKVLLLALAAAFTCAAKDIKTVVLKTNPVMHCENCEKTIKTNIRFEKGIKNIKTNLDNNTVTIEYDADKTNVENIIAGFKKINYEATEANEADATKKDCCQDGKQSDGCCGKKSNDDCCGKKNNE